MQYKKQLSCWTERRSVAAVPRTPRPASAARDIRLTENPALPVNGPYKLRETIRSPVLVVLTGRVVLKQYRLSLLWNCNIK